MAKEYAKKFYNGKAWQSCRESYIYSVYGICERCESPGDIVHHKIHITPDNINNPNITLNHDNLELLCQDCHNKEHHGNKQEVTREGLVFNKTGELVESPLRLAQSHITKDRRGNYKKYAGHFHITPTPRND